VAGRQIIPVGAACERVLVQPSFFQTAMARSGSQSEMRGLSLKLKQEILQHHRICCVQPKANPHSEGKRRSSGAFLHACFAAANTTAVGE